MNRIKLHTDHLGYRLYLIGEDGFDRDSAGRYVVHVLIGKIGSNSVQIVRLPNCVAWTSDEAEKLSREHGRRLIDEGAFPLPQPRNIAAELLMLSSLGLCWKPDRFDAREAS